MVRLTKPCDLTYEAYGYEFEVRFPDHDDLLLHIREELIGIEVIRKLYQGSFKEPGVRRLDKMEEFFKIMEDIVQHNVFEDKILQLGENAFFTVRYL